ncbi:MAG: hypothetical protein P4L84_18330 [Isosphaeraceae bacterium]|nr:hypothetical protein [Isosphaeraceae bacterium]
MTVFVMLVYSAVFAWVMFKSGLGVVRAGGRMPSLSERKARPPHVNVQAVLEAVGQPASRVSRSSRVAAPLPFIPPLEMADPMWDRDVDMGGV